MCSVSCDVERWDGLTGWSRLHATQPAGRWVWRWQNVDSKWRQSPLCSHATPHPCHFQFSRQLHSTQRQIDDQQTYSAVAWSSRLSDIWDGHGLGHLMSWVNPWVGLGWAWLFNFSWAILCANKHNCVLSNAGLSNALTKTGITPL